MSGERVNQEHCTFELTTDTSRSFVFHTILLPLCTIDSVHSLRVRSTRELRERTIGKNSSATNERNDVVDCWVCRANSDSVRTSVTRSARVAQKTNATIRVIGFGCSLSAGTVFASDSTWRFRVRAYGPSTVIVLLSVLVLAREAENARGSRVSARVVRAREPRRGQTRAWEFTEILVTENTIRARVTIIITFCGQSRVLRDNNVLVVVFVVVVVVHARASVRNARRPE